ncbi:Centromere protein mis12 [Grifola frondosa]|uniref:Centromere protein mis12 n=1 Tax=Grifola frondosa TaxID=5627 RepID=A0A1C7MS80_GRIFR|nr:Centromere protein mis12 [Grifola frondosa]
MNGPPPSVPSVLLPELIGFIPQYLLDDIINIANDATKESVEAMERFLERWADARTQKVDAEWDPSQEIEQGLVAFQTLLESHIDIAFDFFEAWSLRNIFAIPADLPIVVPHQQGLDLNESPEREAELLAEITELRRKVHAQRKLRQLFTRAVRKSATQLARSQDRLERLQFLRAPQLQTLLELPDEFHTMYTAVSSLPPLDPTSTVPEQITLSEPGKRLWETSRTGYLNWAVEQLMLRAKSQAKGAGAFGEGSSAIGAAAGAAYDIANADDVKLVLEEIAGKDAVAQLGTQGCIGLSLRKCRIWKPPPTKMPFSTSKCNTCVFQHLSMATLGELQQRLSGDLQLLHYLRLHPARVHEKCHDKNLPPQGQKISGEILNSIALCLVTHEGTPAETTAVSIDLRGGVTLVIAKGRVPTSEDYDAAQRFFFALRTRRTWSSVICEVMSYSWQPMNTRIATLHNTVVQWMSRDPTSFRISEDPSTMELMFPGLLEVVDKSYIVDLNTNNPRLMFVRALDKVLRLSDLKIPPAAKPDDLAVEAALIPTVG